MGYIAANCTAGLFTESSIYPKYSKAEVEQPQLSKVSLRVSERQKERERKRGTGRERDRKRDRDWQTYLYI